MSATPNRGGYAECYAAVMAGRKVTLAVAAYASTDFYSDPIVGKENGVYDCWLQTEGIDPPGLPFFQLQQPPGMSFMYAPEDIQK